MKENYKVCTCCGKEFKKRSDYFLKTSYVGIMRTGKYREYDLEMRNCDCGSTLATHIQKMVLDKVTV